MNIFFDKLGHKMNRIWDCLFLCTHRHKAHTLPNAIKFMMTEINFAYGKIKMRLDLVKWSHFAYKSMQKTKCVYVQIYFEN